MPGIEREEMSVLFQGSCRILWETNVFGLARSQEAWLVPYIALLLIRCST